MRYVLGVIGVIAAFILLIVLIVTLRPDSNNQNQTNTPVPQLADLAGGDSVTRFVSDGPIVASENYREIRIIIDQHKRAVDVIQGYQGTVLATETYDNNKESYTSFLAALDRAGYTLEKRSKYDSSAGLCPLGARFTFDLYNTPNDAPIKSFSRWATNCSTTVASFGGNISLVKSLFRSQIPNYQAFINQTPSANTANL